MTGERETSAGVIGVSGGVCLLLLGLASLGAAALLGAGSDAEALAEELLVGAVPFGLEPHDAMRLPSGDEFLVLEPATDAPAEVGQVILGRSRAARDVEMLFAGDQPAAAWGPPKEEEPPKNLGDWEQDPSYDWHTDLERGDLEWGGWRASFVRRRAFMKGGAWREAVFLNLSTPGRYLVLMVIWPDAEEASLEVVSQLADCVALPLEQAEPGPAPTDR